MSEVNIHLRDYGFYCGDFNNDYRTAVSINGHELPVDFSNIEDVLKQIFEQLGHIVNVTYDRMSEGTDEIIVVP